MRRYERLNGEAVTGDVVSMGVLIPFANLAFWSDAELASFNLRRIEVTQPPAPVIIPNITRRQFFQQLAIEGVITEGEALGAIGAGAIPAILEAIIASLPEGQQFGARCLLVGAQQFEPLHPLSEAVRIARGMSPAQRDAFFIAAAALA